MRTETEQRKIYSDAGGLVIRLNNDGTWFQCNICGQDFDAVIGPELELSRRPSAVCRDCGRKFEPELAKLLDLYNLMNGWRDSWDAIIQYHHQRTMTQRIMTTPVPATADELAAYLADDNVPF